MADVISEDTKNTTFETIHGLQNWMLKQLKKLKLERPTPIQYHCIPAALEGKDVIGTSKTGSGKTLAFVVPILQDLSVDPYAVFALVLTPTRELALQIADQFRALGAPVCLRLEVIIGGLDRVTQGISLGTSPHVVVATPGRLADHLLSEHDFTLKRIKYLVLDEADRLMDGRFDNQLRIIWKELPEKRQTLLFSATTTDRLLRMKELAKSEVFMWKSEVTQATVDQLDERYLLVNPLVRDAAMVATLMKFAEKNPTSLCIVFTNTCKNTQLLSQMLKSLGIDCVSLHSLMSQKDRMAALSLFKSSQVKILLATDLASRGLDIPKVQLVVNHTIPTLPKTYIHRVGRTARAGRFGRALTFITPSEIRMLMAIETLTQRKMGDLTVDERVVKKILKQVNITRKKEEIKLDASQFDEKKKINKMKNMILDGLDPTEEDIKRKRKADDNWKARCEQIKLLKMEFNKERSDT